MIPIITQGEIVSVENFANYVKRMHKDRDKLFEIEYTVCNANE